MPGVPLLLLTLAGSAPQLVLPCADLIVLTVITGKRPFIPSWAVLTVLNVISRISNASPAR